MALPDLFAKLAAPIRRLSRAAVSWTQSFNPTLGETVLSAPAFREHLQDLLTSRQSLDSRQLMQQLMRTDPDVSATVGSYLTLADTPATILVYTQEGAIDLAATKDVHRLIRALTRAMDYGQGFSMKPALSRLCQELRYMAMMRGAIAGELIFDKAMVPTRIQQVDMASIEWFERESGVFKPRQKTGSTGQYIDLDIPSFFVSYHRRDPTTVYAQSDFISAINTIAARTQIINDLYRIMRMTGFPRITLTVLEQVLRQGMPSNIKDDAVASQAWIRTQLTEIGANFGSLRADQPFVKTDSVEVEVLNKDRPGASLQIAEVIETLNAQNQAGLKAMPTVIGRAKSGTNTASTEARIAAMNADQLNVVVKEFLDQALTFLLNVYGIAGFVEVSFAPAEMRPNLELEPQRVMQASRMREDLSLGIITDIEYHMRVHGRLPPENAPTLQGTGFMKPTEGVSVDVEDVTPNDDPLGRSIVPEGAASARSNTVRRAA